MATITKSQLTAQVAARDDIIEVINPSGELAEIVGNIKWYNLYVFEAADDIKAIKKTIQFYVYKEGEAEEAAYYKEHEPKSTVEANDAIKAAIESYVEGMAGVLGFIIDKYDGDQLWAEVRACINNADSTATWKTYLIYRDGATITHIELTNSTRA